MNNATTTNDELNIFELASRMGVRFEYKGSISVEDLWDLNLSDLNEIYKKLNKELRETEGESLMGSRQNTAQRLLELKLSIVKYIYQYKENENKQKEERKEKKEKKQKLLYLLERKQEEKFLGMSEDELKAMIEEL